jgi:hypothetical protein
VPLYLERQAHVKCCGRERTRDDSTDRGVKSG